MQDSRWVLRRAEQRSRIPSVDLLAMLLDAAQDTVGFLGCNRTLPSRVELLIHQYPQVLLLSSE